MKRKTIIATEPLWLNGNLKKMICARQDDLSLGDTHGYLPIIGTELIERRSHVVQNITVQELNN
jgi:hypothetical protein